MAFLLFRVSYYHKYFSHLSYYSNLSYFFAKVKHKNFVHSVAFLVFLASIFEKGICTFVQFVFITCQS